MRHHFNRATLCGSSRSLNKDQNGHQDALAKICKEKQNLRKQALEDAKKNFARPCGAVWYPQEQEYVRVPWMSIAQFRNCGFVVEELW